MRPVYPESLLGRYELIEALGEGGMAHVFKVRHLALDRVAAVKVLKPHVARLPSDRKRFLREARLCSSLDHPHVVKIFEAEAIADTLFIAMEYVGGGSLRDRLDKGLPAAEGLEYVRQVALALHYAHGKGIVHRDLRPANILIAETGEARVADWGFAREVEGDENLTRTGVVLGTPRYMAPEQCAGRELTPLCDLYSLGVMLYEVVALETPFERAGGTARVLEAHLRSRAPRLTGVSPRLADLVESLLSKNPEHRPVSAAMVARRLRRILEEEPLDPQVSGKTVPVKGQVLLSDASGRVATRSLGRPPVVAAAPRRWRAWHGAMGLVVVLAALWMGAWGEREEGAKAEAFAFERPVPHGLDRLVFRVRGRRKEGRYRVAFILPDGRPAPQAGFEIDLAEARPLSRRYRGIEKDLVPRLNGVVKVTLSPGTGARGGVTFTVDPGRVLTEAVQRVLGPVRALRHTDFDALLRRLARIRGRRGSEKAEAIAKAVELALAEAGLSGRGAERLRIELPWLLDRRAYPGSDLARQLLSLRLMEATLAYEGCRPLPWGNVSHMLGFSFYPLSLKEPGVTGGTTEIPLFRWAFPSHGEFTEARARGGGWTSVARTVLVTTAMRAGQERPQWLWMASAHNLAKTRDSSQDMVNIMAVSRHKVSCEQLYQEARPEVYVPSADLPMVVDPPAEVGWPPVEVRVDLLLRFRPAVSLEVRLNGSPPATLVNNVHLFVRKPGYDHHWPVWASVPVDPAFLKRGRNVVRLRVAPLPYEIVADSASLREVGIRVRGGV